MHGLHMLTLVVAHGIFVRVQRYDHWCGTHLSVTPQSSRTVADKAETMVEEQTPKISSFDTN